MVEDLLDIVAQHPSLVSTKEVLNQSLQEIFEYWGDGLQELFRESSPQADGVPNESFLRLQWDFSGKLP